MKIAIKYVLIYLGLSIVGAVALLFPTIIVELALNPELLATDEFSMSPWTQSIMMLGSQLLTLYFFWKKWADYSFIKESGSKSFFLWAAIGWVGCVLIATFIQTYAPQWDWDMGILKEIGDMSRNPLGIISICVMAPLLEEGIFRGTIERKLLEKNRNPWCAIVISALAFAIVHGNLTQGIIALILGLFMGWIYYRTRNIWLCIFVHALNNTVSVVGTWATGDVSGVSPFSLPVDLLLLAVGIGLVIIFALQYKKLPIFVPQPEDKVVEGLPVQPEGLPAEVPEQQEPME